MWEGELEMSFTELIKGLKAPGHKSSHGHTDLILMQTLNVTLFVLQSSEF